MESMVHRPFGFFAPRTGLGPVQTDAGLLSVEQVVFLGRQ